MEKIAILDEVVRRGYFEAGDADIFGKAMVFTKAGDLEALGIGIEDVGNYFYHLAAFGVEDEVVQAATDMNFIVRYSGEFVTFSLL